MATVLRELLDKYRKFVLNNIETVGHVESAARILSYVAPGGSAATSEFFSAVVSLVVLVNDSILRDAASMQLNFGEAQKKLAFCLTIIEYVEVFVEMAAYGESRNVARWIVVVGIQIVKAALRFLLLLKYQAGIVASSPIPSLRRSKELITRIRQGPRSTDETSVSAENTPPNGVQMTSTLSAGTYTLKSTGRTVRSLSGGSTQHTLPDVPLNQQEISVRRVEPTALGQQQIVAESLHILRPLVHLGGMYLCGQSSWKPWLAACGVDLASLVMMGDPTPLNADEREELKRRTVLMLLYLLRSPFYDKYSKEKLLFVLGVLATKVPGIRLVVRPLLEYLPIWQQVYFYVWAV